MLSSSGTEATILFFLTFVKTRTPGVVPTIIMSDRDRAQMNTVSTIYLDSKLLLCWWHVLCAIQMHFRMEGFPVVWDRIREWVKTSDQARFDSLWEWFQSDPSVPQTLVDYLKLNWMTIVPLWSGTMRKKRTIFQEGDTNMLIEL